MAAKGDIRKVDIQPIFNSNWTTVEFDQILVKTKISHKLKSKDFSTEGLFPVVDQGSNLIAGYVDDKKVLYNGKLPVVVFGDHTRNLKFIDFDFAVGADGTKILQAKNGVDAKFLFYYLKSLKIPDFGYSRHFSVFRNLDFPLPPLMEQERIVAKLDKLFAQVEVMKKALERIPQLLKDFRQQVLTQAVTGKLTEKWREHKGVEEWSFEKAVDCCLKVQSGGTPKGSKFSNQGIPFLKVYNIINNRIDFDHEPQYVSEEIHNSQLKKSIAYPGDVIMNIVGPPLNKIAILTDQYPQWNLNQAITIFRVGEKLFNKYLYYFFCEGRSVKSLLNETKGVVGQVNISLSQCRNFDIPIPSIKEQQVIVTRVESIFSKTEKIEEKYKALKAKIESLPQAILYKAFMGKLVEQLPTDGDAKNLLEEINNLKIKK